MKEIAAESERTQQNSRNTGSEGTLVGIFGAVGDAFGEYWAKCLCFF